MKRITRQIEADSKRNLYEFVLDLKNEGCDNATISRYVERYLYQKTDQFYKSYLKPRGYNDFQTIGASIKSLLGKPSRDNADSQAERVFYSLLINRNIDFKFQVEISPYRVDYLIGGFLIFEGDGAHHKHHVEYDQRRDEHLRKLGYKIMRLKWNIVALMTDRILDEIESQVEIFKKKR